ncbi:MAG: LysR family transcriptional regulator [Hyphomicrobiales bacterium]|nr:LysR family transcriptional regulator [Hyphomicrobiales bacterium]
MDVRLARTFLEVISAGSFIRAAERLHVTQSAISLRIQKLEEALGQRLFERSKSGVELTAHGYQFELYARSIIQVWEEARYQIAIPEKFEASLAAGTQYSLWPELTSVWLELMERELPSVALQMHLGMPDRLTRLMMSGLLDIAVVYRPELRPGLKAEHLMDDRLVLVSGDPEFSEGLDDRYIFMDWGPEFTAAHSRWYPDFRLSRTTLMIGAAAVPYLVRNRRSAFLPYRVADDYISAGALHLIPDAPELPYPAYVIWSSGKVDWVIKKALGCLAEAAKMAP